MLKLGKVADELSFVATKDGKTKAGVYGDCLRWLCDGEPPEALVEITGGRRGAARGPRRDHGRAEADREVRGAAPAPRARAGAVSTPKEIAVEVVAREKGNGEAARWMGHEIRCDVQDLLEVLRRVRSGGAIDVDELGKAVGELACDLDVLLEVGDAVDEAAIARQAHLHSLARRLTRTRREEGKERAAAAAKETA